MKTLKFYLLGVVVLMASCAKENTLSPIDSTPLSRTDINQNVNDVLETGEVFHWSKASVQMVWSAAMQSDSILSIGYTLPGIRIDEQIHLIDFSANEWKVKQQELLNFVLKSEQSARNNPDLTLENILPLSLDDKFPQIQVQITSQQLVAALRERQDVRFVEPLGYSKDEEVGEKSGSGCNGSPTSSINSGDFSTTSPSAKVPWNFGNHNIQAAWSSTQGDNIGICIIDSGAADAQDNLGSNFTSGFSGGRYIRKFSTKYSGMWWWRSLDSPNDQCGHGTSMAGLAAAPRSNDGNATGVAYKANLISVRAVEDVIISSSNERSGVRDAMYLAGNRNDVHIISMSLGTPFYSSTVADGVNFAYNKGKLILAAAGTSIGLTNDLVGVIFPANMSKTVAVTGVKDSSNPNRCDVCHYGSQVDFTVVMERANDNNRNSLALASSSNQPKYIGGSSCGTATLAGIAALVWANNPSLSRSAVIQKLKNASQFYPGRDSNYGWGNVNAASAIQ